MDVKDIEETVTDLNRHTISSARAAIALAEDALAEYIVFMDMDSDMLELAKVAAAVAQARIAYLQRS